MLDGSTNPRRTIGCYSQLKYFCFPGSAEAPLVHRGGRLPLRLHPVPPPPGRATQGLSGKRSRSHRSSGSDRPGHDFAVALLALWPAPDADHSGQQAGDEPRRRTWASGHGSLLPTSHVLSEQSRVRSAWTRRCVAGFAAWPTHSPGKERSVEIKLSSNKLGCVLLVFSSSEADNSHLRGKYHCTADLLLFDWFGFYQISTADTNWTQTKQLNLNE